MMLKQHQSPSFSNEQECVIAVIDYLEGKGVAHYCRVTSEEWEVRNKFRAEHPLSPDLQLELDILERRLNHDMLKRKRKSSVFSNANLSQNEHEEYGEIHFDISLENHDDTCYIVQIHRVSVGRQQPNSQLIATCLIDGKTHDIKDYQQVPIIVTEQESVVDAQCLRLVSRVLQLCFGYAKGNRFFRIQLNTQGRKVNSIDIAFQSNVYMDSLLFGVDASLNVKIIPHR